MGMKCLLNGVVRYIEGVGKQVTSTQIACDLCKLSESL